MGSNELHFESLLFSFTSYFLYFSGFLSDIILNSDGLTAGINFFPLSLNK